MNYPCGVEPKDFDEKEMTVWKAYCCEKCGADKPLSEELICEDCFEPQNIEQDEF